MIIILLQLYIAISCTGRFFSLDFIGKFTNMVSKWPGSTHDSHLFRTSNIHNRLEGNDFENGVLIGDSGYACLPYLMTPYPEPKTQCDKRM
jgi:hypothetical protein